jgi:hypothetical protein
MKWMLALMVFSLSSWAFGQKTGLGISLGNPTGLSAKRWLNASQAVDGGAGFSFGKHTNFGLHSDYLFHQNSAFYFNDVYPLDLYYGIGGRMEFADDIEVGVRLPVGLVHQVDGAQADMFGEIAPVIDFISHKGVELHLLFGSRYYF